VSKDSVFDEGGNIRVFVRLVQKSVVLFVEIAEGGSGGDDMSNVTEEHEEGVEEGHFEDEVV